MKYEGQTSRRSVIGLLLLASMLFYVSGAALGLHLQFEHSHIATGDVVHDHEHDGDRAPAEEPGVPSRQTCELCNMLAGIQKPMVFPIVSTPAFFIPETYAASTPDVVVAERFLTNDISRRGPPVLT